MPSREKIATCLAERDWSLHRVAKKAGIPDTTIRGWLVRQSDDIGLSKIWAISVVLGVSLDWIADDDQADDVIPDWARRERKGAAGAEIIAVRNLTSQPTPPARSDADPDPDPERPDPEPGPARTRRRKSS
jgi:transcriptional regulator with XRE-family HTH domain